MGGGDGGCEYLQREGNHLPIFMLQSCKHTSPVCPIQNDT